MNKEPDNQLDNWLNQALAIKPQSRIVQVAGSNIHYLHWHSPSKPGLVLVHGHGAHAHWWDHLAPSFMVDYDTVAIDLSGSGDSGHRESYSVSGFADEIFAVAQDARLEQPALIGHSFGGTITRIAAWLHPKSLSQILLVDSVLPAKRSQRPATTSKPRQRQRIYKTLPDGMKRFRLRPPQPIRHRQIVDHIAAHSLRQTPAGYIFKLDQLLFARMTAAADLPAATLMISELQVPAAMIIGEQSRFFPPQAIDEARPLFPDGRLVVIPDAAHHLLLDQPLQFIDAAKSLLSLA